MCVVVVVVVVCGAGRWRSLHQSIVSDKRKNWERKIFSTSAVSTQQKKEKKQKKSGTS